MWTLFYSRLFWGDVPERSRNREGESAQWRAHGRYIARESAGDPRLWKLIVSPEFGERLDLDRLTRDLMARMEMDLGTRLEWMAVTHFNTEHPHLHIALRGVRDDKSALDLPRDYVRQGIRAIAEDLCTQQLGRRNQLDAIASERREIQERRFTSLDGAINRANSAEVSDAGSTAEHFPIRRAGETGVTTLRSRCAVSRIPSVLSNGGSHLASRTTCDLCSRTPSRSRAFCWTHPGNSFLKPS